MDWSCVCVCRDRGLDITNRCDRGRFTVASYLGDVDGSPPKINNPARVKITIGSFTKLIMLSENRASQTLGTRNVTTSVASFN